MRILVDADACPDKNIIIELANKYHIELHFFTDINHDLSGYDAKVHIVDQGRDSVDFAIIGAMKQGDLIVTADYGVASLALGRNGLVINPSGKQLHHDNIDQLMFERHLGQNQDKQGFEVLVIKTFFKRQSKILPPARRTYTRSSNPFLSHSTFYLLYVELADWEPKEYTKKEII